MLTGAWLFGVAVALLAVNLAATSLLDWLGGDSGQAVTARTVENGDQSSTAPGDDGVECPRCGTENDPEYRFCRSCVAQLPGAGSTRQRASPPGWLTR
ncbi:zinc ribbon domain-containing protein [Halobacterium rubrum]|uniref:zinc ribbon domain-containing protein n=1 Tax=Halobacterium TaxID=2239 RepID=UPI001F3A56CD|nr:MULTISPECIES: zinc ribbon domain-containing protein [Halobacterium]MDH5020912.1 zinc ribbon domain-containing protein [Halobacterium rubrum]